VGFAARGRDPRDQFVQCERFGHVIFVAEAGRRRGPRSLSAAVSSHREARPPPAAMRVRQSVVAVDLGQVRRRAGSPVAVSVGVLQGVLAVEGDVDGHSFTAEPAPIVAASSPL